MPSKARKSFDAETVSDLARRFADYHTGGYPTGGSGELMATVRKVAGKHGRSYSELWQLVHAEGTRLMLGPHA